MKFASGTDSIVDDIDFWAGTNSTTYPIAAKTRNANQAGDRVTSIILRFDTSWEWDDFNNTDLPIATTSLVSGQADYSIAATHLKILRVRAKDANGNWQTLRPGSRRNLSDSDLEQTGTPGTYDKLGNSIFVNSIPNYASSGGLEVQFQRGGEYFTTSDTTKEPGFASQFHRLISLHAALDYCDKNNLAKRAAALRKKIGNPPSPERGIIGSGMEGELAEFYASRDWDRPHRIGIRKDDYGASAMTHGAHGGHPDRFNL